MTTAPARQTQGVPASLLRVLKDAVGPQGWTEAPEELARHLTDWRGLYRGAAPILLRPASTAEVSRVVGLCAAARIGVVPQGGNTGLVGGATPPGEGGAILLNLGRMNRIRQVDALDDTMTVEAGCILAQVQEEAARADRLFPLSLGAEGTCQIGGNLSTNAGGIAVLRYGNARDLVLGLEVVLPDGRVWDGLRSLRKDNTGYDLKQLFIGAEGTLGIITAAVLKLFPRPRERATAFAALTRLPAVLDLLVRCRAASGDSVTSFELIPRIALDLAQRHVPATADPLSGRHAYYVLIEFSSAAEGADLKRSMEEALGRALEDGLIADAAIAESEAQAARLWQVREAIVEGQRLEGPHLKHDVSVPVSAAPAFIEEALRRVEAQAPGTRAVPFGHVGDGNVHLNLARPEGSEAAPFLARAAELGALVHDLAAAHGGSFSAEHGIGQLKRADLRHYRPAIEIELMRRIKAALDPDGIMNPGKVL